MNGKQELPIRAAVFSNTYQVEEVIRALLAAGISHSEITVVCSDEAQKHHFREYVHQQPAGARTPAAAAVGGVTGATLGGLATVAIAFATGVLPVAIIGGAGLMTGGVVGSLLGALVTRGMEKEAANFYDQAVQDGKLLVVVEQRESSDRATLDVAERLLTKVGAKPLPLPEG
jgi:ABC-type nitrate/sulfonate/bicarbonate transport system substrate-binding protein